MGIIKYEIINTEAEQSKKHRWKTNVSLGVGPKLACATGKELMQWGQKKRVWGVLNTLSHTGSRRTWSDC